MLIEEDKQEIKQIIANELSQIIKIDRFVISKNVQVLNARNFQFGRTNGTKLGTKGYVDAANPGQKIGLWGTTPITQPSAIADPTGGVTTDAEARTAIDAILDALQAIGIIQT